MPKQDLKYLLVWFMPIFGYVGLHVHSYLSPGSFYLAFILIPLLELGFKPKHLNLSDELKTKRKYQVYFDIVLYLNIPMLYGLLVYFFYLIQQDTFLYWEMPGVILNMGILLAVHGINVAHELGHRTTSLSKISARLLLLPSLYMHFTVEHNHWHHKYVATDKDPSSAHLNESLYAFWLRSICGVFKNSWDLEKKRQSHLGLSIWNLNNRLIIQLIFQFIYLLVVVAYTGFIGLAAAIIIALISICMLETINYIEHYGLRRKQFENGQWEPVSHLHSWNSDHPVGRIFLYELTRHPSHHMYAHQKFQNLDSEIKAPQLPFGYPASMLMALVPNLWFSVMNKRIPTEKT